MRDYGRVSPQFWLGFTGKRLRGDPEAQIVALYFQTSPHSTMIGVFHCPLPYVSHETGLSLEGVLKGLQRLIDEGFCTYDHDLELVWVHEMAKYQIGADLKPNDKQVTGIKKVFEQIPECQIKRGFHARYQPAFHLPNIEDSLTTDDGASRGYRRGIEAPPKPGTGTGDGTGAGDSSLPNGSDSPHPLDDDHRVGKGINPCPHQEIINAYQELLPMGRQVRDWNDTRKGKLRARWREDPSRQNIKWWRRFFTYIAESDFLTGRTSTIGRAPFEIDLEWIVTSSNFVKILEGKYETRRAA